MAFNYDKYLRTNKMPTLWCWGCGDGVILKTVIRAIDKMGWNMDDVCVVSGIGCSGRFSSYVDCNTVHTTHGRAIAYATGIKLANPDKHVIVVTGDGDGLGITATGVPAVRGIAAVDPDVIPLGTRLFIPGYGEAIAADTGGAIIGNKIDLVMDSYGEAMEFGRQDVTVYVLD